MSYACSKAIKALNKVCRFLSYTDGLNTRNSIILYESLVRPHLEYAYPVWASVKEKDVIKIDRIQRTALLKASGCLNSSPTSALEVLTNVLPIRLRLQELLSYEYIRLLRKEDNNLIRAIALCDQNNIKATSNPQLILPAQMMLCAIRPTAR